MNAFDFSGDILKKFDLLFSFHSYYYFSELIFNLLSAADGNCSDGIKEFDTSELTDFPIYRHPIKKQHKPLTTSNSNKITAF